MTMDAMDYLSRVHSSDINHQCSSYVTLFSNFRCLSLFCYLLQLVMLVTLLLFLLLFYISAP